MNEMLTRVEAFPGLFIASANRMEDLDPAALRRFDLKVRSGFLRPEPAQELFRRWCRAWGIADLGAAEIDAFARLENLTPGDFAAVARRHRFHPMNPAPGRSLPLRRSVR